MEQWNLYDEERKLLPQIHTKGKRLEAGCYHVVVGIWVINSNKELLITKRAMEKEKYPGLWENTYGSLLVGESSCEGAIRELYEETGIRVSKEMLRYCCTTKSKTSFVDMYILKKDFCIMDMKMQEGETTAAKWVSLSMFENMFLTKEISPLAIERYYLVRDMLINI